MHALAARHLEEVQELLALAEAVPPDRDRAEVQRTRPEPHEVAHDPVELHVDDAQVLGARRHVDLKQRLDGAAERVGVEVVGEVVHPLDDGDDLPVAHLLGGLLDAGVHVADDRLDVAQDLAVERDEQPQHTVRRRMVGTDVQCQQLAAVGVDRRLLGERDRLLHLAIARAGHANHRGVEVSLWVKRTGSPPIGKSRRCGWPS